MVTIEKFSKKLWFRHIKISILTGCLFLTAPLSVVLAGPEGTQVINGQASFQQTGSNTTITASDQAIINYSSFNIAKPETVQFIQPGSNASVLNRIISASPTTIDGTLLANGRVFFVNPAGVVIGSSAQINVNQLVASGLDISNSSFLSGQYEFTGGSGSVINSGEITANSVYLIGKQVTNSGTIICPQGYVVMAAGERVFLGEPGSNVVVEIDTLETSDQLDTDTQSDSGITNEGVVEASGGSIILALAGDVFSQPIIKNSGLLSASAVEGDAGHISLQADGGQISNTGSITATSDAGLGGTITANAGEIVNLGKIDVSGNSGGLITLEGSNRVGQFGTVNADGSTGGGGDIALRADEMVVIGAESLTTANAGANGDGGEIIAYSPGMTMFRSGGVVEAKGGSESGNGGFFEISGKEYVEIQGQINLSAANGENGTFLIDPYNIIIDDSGLDNGIWTGGQWEPAGEASRLGIDILEAALDSADVIISTTGDGQGTEDGDVTFNAGRFLESGTNSQSPSNSSLTVEAAGDIKFEAGNGINFTGDGDVKLYAGGSITSVDRGESVPTVSTLRGDIIMTAGSDASGVGIDIGYLNAGASGLDFPGEIRLTTTGGGDITTEHLRVRGNGYGSIYVFSSGNLTINGSSSLQGAVLINTNHVPAGDDASSFICLSAEGDATINGDVTVEAHGKDKTRAGIWIGAGTETRDGTVTINGNLEAVATTAQDAPFKDSQATIKVYASTINFNGSQDPHAKADRAEVKTAVSDSDEETGDDRHFIAAVDVDRTKDSTCLDCINRPLPVALNDSTLINKDTSVNIDVLSNDVDEEGNPLSGGVIDSYTDPAGGGLLTPIEVDGQIVAFEYTPPTDAVFVNKGNQDENGAYAVFTDTFTYIVRDIEGQISTESATVTITVKNYIPVANNGSNSTHMGDGIIDVTFNFSDYDDSTSGLTVNIENGPINGTLTANGDGTYTYNPTQGYVGGDSFTYSVTDGSTSATATFTIDIWNNPPAPVTDTVSTHMGTPIIINISDLLANDTDPDSDQVSFASFTYTGEGTLIDNGDMTLTYTPKEGFVGNDTFSYTVTDPEVGGVAVETTVQISTWNNPPAPVVDTVSTHMGTPVIINISDLLSNDGDPENDSLTFNSLTYSGIGTLIDNGDGTLTYTPPAGYTGNDSFTYSISDGELSAGAVNTTVTLTMFNKQPLINKDTILTQKDMVITFNISELLGNDKDAENDLLTITSFDYTGNGSLVLNDGVFTYTPREGYTGTERFTYYVSDGELGADSIGGTVTILVKPPRVSAPPIPGIIPPQVQFAKMQQVEGATALADLLWMAQELMLCQGNLDNVEDQTRCMEITQAYLAGAFLQATDLHPFGTARQLRNLAGLLHDPDGYRTSAVSRVIAEFVQPDMPPSPEQFALIVQAFEQHGNDGTHYATAKQWLDALAEYMLILNSEVGWSLDECVTFVMGKYSSPLTESGSINAAVFIQLYLEDAAKDRQT